VIGATTTTDVAGMVALVKLSRQRDITLKGVKAGVKVLERAAKAGAPKASGALRVAQGNKAKKGRSGGTTSYAVQGAKTKTEKMVTRKGRRTPTRAVPAFYDHLVNLGTKPHAVGKGSALGRKGKPAGAQVGGLHPGTAAQPFRRRAWAAVKDQAGGAALKAMAAAVQSAIAKGGA